MELWAWNLRRGSHILFESHYKCHNLFSCSFIALVIIDYAMYVLSMRPIVNRYEQIRWYVKQNKKYWHSSLLIFYFRPETHCAYICLVSMGIQTDFSECFYCDYLDLANLSKQSSGCYVGFCSLCYSGLFIPCLSIWMLFLTCASVVFLAAFC